MAEPTRRTFPAWALPLLLYAVALAARLALVGVRPYGDEAHHYYIARHFGDGPHNIHGMLDNHWLFWWRPLFSLLLSPGAQFGFTGFRVGYILLSAALAPLLMAWLRARGVRTPASVAAGAVAALHPFLLVWGVRAFPDELMATLFVGGLALWERRWHATGALVLLAACWTKEVALVGVAVVLAEELAAGLRRPSRWAVDLRVEARHVLLVAVLALSYLPHLYAERIGGRSPGWTRGGDTWSIVDGAFTTVWMVPAVAAGLFFRPSRRPALLALAYLAFFAAYHLAIGGAAEAWYFVLPTVLAAAAVAAGLDAALAKPRTRRWARPAAAAVALVVLLQVLVPSTAVAKQPLLHPGTGTLELSYPEAVRSELERDHDLWRAIGRMDETDRQNVLLVDVAWFHAIWPASERFTFVAPAFTAGREPDWVWEVAVEQVANTTLLHREATPLSRALLDTYADCVEDPGGEYVLLRGQGCAGRLERLKGAYARYAAQP